MTTFDDIIDVRTVSTGWNNAFVFSLDDALSGATGTTNSVSVNITATQSLPTGGQYGGYFNLQQVFKRFAGVNNAIPSGATVTINTAVSDVTSWGVTMSASGPTGYIQVQGGSGTVQFGGTVSRTRVAG